MRTREVGSLDCRSGEGTREVKRDAKTPLDPKAARPVGVDREGSLWVDGNAKGIRSAVASDDFRRGWERIWGKQKRGQYEHRRTA